MPDRSSSKDIFPDIQSEPPLMQLEAINGLITKWIFLSQTGRVYTTQCRQAQMSHGYDLDR